MAPESSRNTYLRLVFLILVVAALARSSCVLEFFENPNPEGELDNSISYIVNPQGDEVVRGIVAATEKAYNLESNDFQQFEVSENGITAFSKVVDGVKYCVKVTLVSVDSKDEKKVTCEVLAYKALTEKAAKILDRPCTAEP